MRRSTEINDHGIGNVHTDEHGQTWKKIFHCEQKIDLRTGDVESLHVDKNGVEKRLSKIDVPEEVQPEATSLRKRIRRFLPF